MKKWFIKTILSFPKTIVFIMVGMTMIFASFMENLEFDNSTENIFPENNVEVQYFQKFRKKFGSDEFLAIVLHPKKHKTVFTSEILSHLKKLTNQFQDIQFVENVISLTTMKKPKLKEFQANNLPIKEIYRLVMTKLSAKERENLLKAIVREQLQRKNLPPLPEKEVVKMVFTRLTAQERYDLVEGIVADQLGKEAMELSEQKVTKILMDSLTKKQRDEVFSEIAQAQMLGTPLSKPQIFKLIYKRLDSKQKDELIKKLLATSLQGPELDLSLLAFFQLPEEKRHQIFHNLALAQLEGKKMTKADVFLQVYKETSTESKKKILAKVQQEYFKKPEFQKLFRPDRVLKIIFSRLSPSTQDSILEEILQKYVTEGELDPDREALFKSVFLQLPAEKREEVLKEIFIHHINPDDLDIEIVDFFENYPPSAEEIEDARKLFLKIPLARGNVLPRKGLDKTAVVLQVKRPKTNPEQALAEIVKKVRKILVETKTEGTEDIEYYIAGSPAIKADILRAIKMDVATFVPLTILIIMLIVFYLFRTKSSVILPLMVIFVTDIWVLGLMAYFGYPLNTLTSLIISLMFVIGVADVVHLMAKYFDELERTGKKMASLEHMLDQLLLPCWITSFTTMVGFGSLMISDVEPIRNFGLFAAIGSFLAFALSILIVTPAFQLFGITRESSRDVKKGIGGGLKVFFRISTYRWPVVFVAIGALVYSVVGIQMMNVETNFVEFFKKDSRLRQANDFVEKHFAGIAPLEIVYIPKKGNIQDYQNLKHLEKFQDFLNRDTFLKPYIDQTTSVVDFYKFTHMVKLPDVEQILKPENIKVTSSILDKNRYRLPETAEAYHLDLALFNKTLAQYEAAEQGVKKFMAHSLEEDQTTGPWKVARISIRMKAVSSREGAKVVEYIREHAKKKHPEANIHVTGTAALFAEAANSIVESQKKSFLLAIVIIFITMIVVFRSLIVGFLGLIPNILPIATTFGSMGWLGIPLNSSTSMVASISIGIAVDVAVHFISRFRLEREKTSSIFRAVLATFRKTGKPILFTSSILMAGFLVLCLASFVPTIQFGILTCITIFSALLAGLIVLPAVIFLIYERRSPLKKESKEEGESQRANESESDSQSN